nr:immunoglobulin heavy chain junction region [Mus musculus]
CARSTVVEFWYFDVW